MNIENLTNDELRDASEWIMQQRRKDSGGVTLRSAFVAAQFLKDELQRRNRIALRADYKG